MKKLKDFLTDALDIKSSISFLLVLLFLISIHFSIFAGYFIFCWLTVNLIIFTIRQKKLPGRPPYYKYFIIFVIFTLISTIFSIDKLNSLKDNKEIFIFLLIPIFLLVIDSRKRINISMATILFSTVLSSLIGIFYIIREGISLEHRLKGFTSHWMTYSGLLMFVFLFFFVYLFYEKSRNNQMIITASLFIILSTILFSQTRSVWVGIAVSIMLFIIFFKPRFLLYIIPAILILITITPESVKQRMVSIFDLQNVTNRDRIHMAETGIKIFRDYPITGVGANNIEKVYPKYKPPQATQNNPHLHNNFLQILAERGVLAFLALVAAFISILINLVIRIRTSKEMEKAIATGVLFVFIGFLTAGIFEYNFGDSEIKFLLFYFLSIPFAKLGKQK
jgi:O-antigen ligase